MKMHCRSRPGCIRKIQTIWTPQRWRRRARQGNPRQVQSAIDKLEVLASKAPGNPVVQLNLGRAFAAKGDRDSLAKARQHLETSLNLNRDFVPAELALAGVQLELGENAMRGCELRRRS